jgi:drug/metabolite transporter (DMT)-like permease
MSPPRSPRSDAALLFVVLVWGLNFPIIKVALEPMPPYVVNAFRFAVSAVVLGAIHGWRTRHTPGGFIAPIREHGWMVAGLGLLGYVLYQWCFIVGVNATSAGSAALIIASSPMWTAIIARMLGMERLPLGAWGGLALSLAGTVLVVVAAANAPAFAEDTLFGNTLMLGGALLWAAYTVLSRPALTAGVSAVGLAFFGILIALPILWALGWSDLDQVDWAEVTPTVWAAIVFSGGFSTGIAYGLWNIAVQRVGPSATAIYNNLVPVVALASGVVLIGERVTLYQLLGGALILGGLLLMRRARRRTVLV